MNGVSELAASCKEPDTAEITARQNLIGQLANEIDEYAKAKAARRKATRTTGWEQVETHAHACMDQIFELPVLDKRVAGYLAECRSLVVESDNQ